MDKIIVCPHCQGRREMPILNDDKFDKEQIVEWLEKPCVICKGKGFILITPEELVKL